MPRSARIKISSCVIFYATGSGRVGHVGLVVMFKPVRLSTYGATASHDTPQDHVFL
jgi:hypothetical protein